MDSIGVLVGKKPRETNRAEGIEFENLFNFWHAAVSECDEQLTASCRDIAQFCTIGSFATNPKVYPGVFKSLVLKKSQNGTHLRAKGYLSLPEYSFFLFTFR